MEFAAGFHYFHWTGIFIDPVQLLYLLGIDDHLEANMRAMVVIFFPLHHYLFDVNTPV